MSKKEFLRQYNDNNIIEGAKFYFRNAHAKKLELPQKKLEVS